MKFEILNCYTFKVQFIAEIECEENKSYSIKLGLAVKFAIKSGANLSEANLSGADLSRADLFGANLSGADLFGADLSRADLSRADLFGANLSRADLFGANLFGASLYGANLSGADLSGASLSRADLSGADLSRADLFGADLSGADLSRADLSRADLSRADLSGADLSSIRNSELSIARTIIVPNGELDVWKKCRNGVLVEMRVPREAKRSSASGRKCRAEFVDVIKVHSPDGIAYSTSDAKNVLEYRDGIRLNCHEWDDNRWNECSGGIHFYLTKEEALAH